MSLNSDRITDQRKLAGLDTATLSWQGSVPRSSKYDDIYFSSIDGLDETRYVFVDGNKLLDRWPGLLPGSLFTIAETGFGTGLNFLATTKIWLENPSSCNLLHYISIEKYPLSHLDIAKALAAWPELAPLTEQLLKQLPSPTPGFHRLYIQDKNKQGSDSGKSVVLTLIYDEAEKALRQLCSSDHPSFSFRRQFTVDAWYLDGFAPAKNPQMWTDRLFQQIAQLSGLNTTFATFTAAGVVRRGLGRVGFAVTTQCGHGDKRDMLTGSFRGTDMTPGERPPPAKNTRANRRRSTNHPPPWYIPSPRGNCSSHEDNADIKHAAVIGGGIAGCTAAHALAVRGWQVTIYEKSGALGAGASGNPQGIIYPRLSTEKSSLSVFNLAALLFACRFYERFWNASKPENRTQFGQRCGVLVLPEKLADQKLFRRIAHNFRNNTELVSLLNTNQIQSISGIFLNADSALYFPGPGWIKPEAVCRSLGNHTNIKFTHADIGQLDWDDLNGNWILTNKNDAQSYSYKTVILATGYQLRNFDVSHHLPVKAVRGQVSIASATKASRHLRVVICGSGYIAPVWQDSHTFGATYNPDTNTPDVRHIDHENNMAQLNTTDSALLPLLDHPNTGTLEGRVGIRCTTPDYLPIVGPAPKLENFLGDYAELRRDARADIPVLGSHWPGLYIHSGFGSRGFNYAPLTAELLANMINNEVPALPRELQIALHPARFIIRDLKRKKI